MRPGLRACAGSSTDPDPRSGPTRIETFNPTALGRPRHAPVVRFADEYGLPHVGNSDAHALDAIGHRLDDVRGPDRRGPAAAIARARARPSITARSTAPPASSGRSGEQLRKRGRDARDELIGRLRRDGTGRDHGYPGGRARPPRFDAAEPAR